MVAIFPEKNGKYKSSPDKKRRRRQKAASDSAESKQRGQCQQEQEVGARQAEGAPVPKSDTRHQGEGKDGNGRIVHDLPAGRWDVKVPQQEQSEYDKVDRCHWPCVEINQCREASVRAQLLELRSPLKLATRMHRVEGDG